MTYGLKITLLSSFAIAMLLNLAQFATSYNQQARASFAPDWASRAAKPFPNPASAAPSLPPSPAEPTSSVPAMPDPVAIAQSKLNSAGLKPTYAGEYISVEGKTGTPWQILAAVHQTETGQSGDTAIRSYAGATGPMQFMPATFAHYALDGDSNGTRDVTDLDDALLTAGRYLAAGGADKGRYDNALFNYNHSNSYVAHVLGIAHRLGL